MVLQLPRRHRRVEARIDDDDRPHELGGARRELERHPSSARMADRDDGGEPELA